MAYSLNRAQIIGNLTRDPEVRMAGGQKVANFGVATSRSWTDQSGQKKEKTEFHNVVVWRKLAEICEQYLRKGQKVYIEGRMETRDWEGEDGVKRYKTEIVAENMIMLGRKGENSPASYAENSVEETPAPACHKGIIVEEAPAPAVEKSEESRAQGRVKPVAKPENAAEVKEEEVSIDDLPF